MVYLYFAKWHTHAPVKTPPGQQSKMSSTSQIKIISAAIFSWCFRSLKSVPSLFYLLFNPYAGNESILNFKVVQTFFFFFFPTCPQSHPCDPQHKSPFTFDIFTSVYSRNWKADLVRSVRKPHHCTMHSASAHVSRSSLKGTYSPSLPFGQSHWLIMLLISFFHSYSSSTNRIP